MTIKLKDLKKEMKTGKSLVGTYAPPKFLYRDANSYTELPIIPKTLELIPKKLDSEVSDLDFIGVIKSEYPNRKKPKGSKSKEVGPSYRVTIKFIGVKFSETKDGVHTEEVIFKKKKLYFKRPSLNNNPAKIRCQCSDFRHKFETPIAQAGALAYGTPRPYIRKTAIPTDANFAKWEKGELDQKPMPYANPTEKLGYCKHIHSFLAYLMDVAKLVKS